MQIKQTVSAKYNVNLIMKSDQVFASYMLIQQILNNILGTTVLPQERANLHGMRTAMALFTDKCR